MHVTCYHCHVRTVLGCGCPHKKVQSRGRSSLEPSGCRVKLSGVPLQIYPNSPCLNSHFILEIFWFQMGRICYSIRASLSVRVHWATLTLPIRSLTMAVHTPCEVWIYSRKENRDKNPIRHNKVTRCEERGITWSILSICTNHMVHTVYKDLVEPVLSSIYLVSSQASLSNSRIIHTRVIIEIESLEKMEGPFRLCHLLNLLFISLNLLLISLDFRPN